MRKDNRSSAIIVSRFVGIAFLVLYSLQLLAIIWLVWVYYDQRILIGEQEKHIEELERKLKILEIIDEYQIGFSDDEILMLANVIDDESGKLGLDPLLVLAVILTESSFKRNQRSHMGAVGLMQVKPSIGLDVANRWRFDWPSSEALYDPVINIRIGTAYLFELILKFRDVKNAIIAYNLGETVTREYQIYGVAPPSQYYRKVRYNYLKLRRQFEDSN
jgi:soluble lytic murein transglycosylase